MNHGTILITGATSGIGEETAQYLSEEGYPLILLGRNKQKLTILQDKFVNCLCTYCLDLANTEKIAAVFEDIERQGIQLRGLVHSAGLEGASKPVRSINYETMETLMKVHYIAFVEMGKNFYKRAISEDGSSIIALSSIAVDVCKKGATDYACSKAAVNIAAKIMAKEFSGRRIRVNTIMPANVDTEMTAYLKEKEIIDMKKEQPWGMIDAKQIAYLIEFLISDRSQYITGANIPVSAGMNF